MKHARRFFLHLSLRQSSLVVSHFFAYYGGKMMGNRNKGRHLVLVGGGHAHIETLLNLNEFTSRGHGVTLISPSPHHYYSGMGPGMLSGIYRPRDVRFNVRKMAEGRNAAYLEDAVESIDPLWPFPQPAIRTEDALRYCFFQHRE